MPGGSSARRREQTGQAVPVPLVRGTAMIVHSYEQGVCWEPGIAERASKESKFLEASWRLVTRSRSLFGSPIAPFASLPVPSKPQIAQLARAKEERPCKQRTDGRPSARGSFRGPPAACGMCAGRGPACPLPRHRATVSAFNRLRICFSTLPKAGLQPAWALFPVQFGARKVFQARSEPRTRPRPPPPTARGPAAAAG